MRTQPQAKKSVLKDMAKSNIRLIGPRVLLSFVPPKERVGRIWLPNVAGNLDTHRLGVVEVCGEECKLVKAGQTVVFQINDVMKWAQVYKRLADDKNELIHVLESELIGTIDGQEITPETFHVVGDFVLVKAEIRRAASNIIVPQDAAVTPDMIHYRLVDQGQTAGIPAQKGQEILINHGKVSSLFMQTKHERRDEMVNLEFGYTLKDWVCGVVEDDEPSPRTEA